MSSTEATSLDFYTVLRRNGHCITPGFDPGLPLEDILPDINILCVGAGGIGCELMHSIAVSPLSLCNLHLVDMDTIDLSNLNRQFLFREEHIGKSKCEVAAAEMKKRFPHMKITPHHCRIEQLGANFYRGMHAILLGLDSVNARLWANGTVATLYWEGRCKSAGAGEEADAAPPAIYLMDSGTEGYKGSVRRIQMGDTPCIECGRYMFPDNKTVPMCTLENIPRVPEHAVLYVMQRTFEQEAPFKDDKGQRLKHPDGDDPEHISWIMVRARERAEKHKLDFNKIDFAFTQGVVKNIVAAVGFSNALVAATMVNETLKYFTAFGPLAKAQIQTDGSCSLGMGSTTPFTMSNPDCPDCSPRACTAVPASTPYSELVQKGWAALTAGTELAGKPLRARIHVTASIDLQDYTIYPATSGDCLPQAKNGMNSNSLANTKLTTMDGQTVPVTPGETAVTLTYTMIKSTADNGIPSDDDPNDILGRAQQRVMVMLQ